jgi:hypothetical protein
MMTILLRRQCPLLVSRVVLLVTVIVAPLLPEISRAAHGQSITCEGTLTEYTNLPPTVQRLARKDTIASINRDGLITCYLPWGGAGHSPFRGICNEGASCRVVGIFSKKIGGAYWVDRDWTRICSVERCINPKTGQETIPVPPIKTGIDN